MPLLIDSADPTANRPKAAMRAQTNAARPYPSGWPSSAGFAERRSAMRRNTSLPVSAHECAASATIEAEPVSAAATDLATAMRALAARAMMTVNRVPLGLVAVS